MCSSDLYFQVINTQLSGRRLGDEDLNGGNIDGKGFIGKSGALIRQMAKVPMVIVDQTNATFDGCTFDKIEVTDRDYTVLVDVGTATEHTYSVDNLKLTFDARPDLK